MKSARYSTPGDVVSSQLVEDLRQACILNNKTVGAIKITKEKMAFLINKLPNLLENAGKRIRTRERKRKPHNRAAKVPNIKQSARHDEITPNFDDATSFPALPVKDISSETKIVAVARPARVPPPRVLGVNISVIKGVMRIVCQFEEKQATFVQPLLSLPSLPLNFLAALMKDPQSWENIYCAVTASTMPREENDIMALQIAKRLIPASSVTIRKVAKSFAPSYVPVQREGFEKPLGSLFVEGTAAIDTPTPKPAFTRRYGVVPKSRKLAPMWLQKGVSWNCDRKQAVQLPALSRTLKPKPCGRMSKSQQVAHKVKKQHKAQMQQTQLCKSLIDTKKEKVINSNKHNINSDKKPSRPQKLAHRKKVAAQMFLSQLCNVSDALKCLIPLTTN